MTSRNKTARIAGLLYLILVVAGIFNLMYIPSQLIVWENAAETFATISQSEALFRAGIVAGIIAFLAFLLLPLALYKLLHEVSEGWARLMVIFALVSVPISFVNILQKFSILTLISQPEFIGHWDSIELQTQVMLHLDNYRNGVDISQIFWGLWLFPFGLLVYRSGFLPRAFGILLMAGCFGYLITFFGGFLYSGFYQTIFSDIVGLPASIGEIGICLWLLVMATNRIKPGKTND